MKSYYKSELAMMAGVSVPTFQRWMRRHVEKLESMGVSHKAKLLPPKAVKFVCEEFGITIDESILSPHG